MRRTETPKPIWIKFCMVVDIPGYGVFGWRGVKFPPLPLTFIVALTTLSHYRASVWYDTRCYFNEIRSSVLPIHPQSISLVIHGLWRTVSRQVVLTCTNGVSPSHLFVIVASDRQTMHEPHCRHMPINKISILNVSDVYRQIVQKVLILFIYLFICQNVCNVQYSQ